MNEMPLYRHEQFQIRNKEIGPTLQLIEIKGIIFQYI